ncbi:hypothetical protein CBR_g40900 [Chara braunii]|uniref:Reverse transcriptase domain-containing protein n=1 Tax=Chara braunii TaxID=69332 RepID=A0A388K2C0_CHABU|nr:hypothetical protein CBR_g40900 [Chara braunii]|eukprot:GBG64200.1 hypothetical protein CBR_g40900 [Chara braunii]
MMRKGVPGGGRNMCLPVRVRGLVSPATSALCHISSVPREQNATSAACHLTVPRQQIAKSSVCHLSSATSAVTRQQQRSQDYVMRRTQRLAERGSAGTKPQQGPKTPRIPRRRRTTMAETADVSTQASPKRPVTPPMPVRQADESQLVFLERLQHYTETAAAELRKWEKEEVPRQQAIQRQLEEAEASRQQAAAEAAAAARLQQQQVEAMADCSPALAAQAKQLEERINHVVASLGDISKFAEASTVSNQLQTLSDRVQQRTAAVLKEWKMPNFKIEKFDDYHKTDPLQWWMAFNVETGVHHVLPERRLDALYLQLIGGAQAFMIHMTVTLECTIATLHTKVTWEEFEKKWKTRFMVNNDKRQALNKIFRIFQSQQPSREWLTEWRSLVATPELNLSFDAIRAEFFARSCDGLIAALGSEFQYETFDAMISKARELCMPRQGQRKCQASKLEKLSTTRSAATSVPNPPDSAALLAVSLTFGDDAVVASSRIDFENYAVEMVPPLNQPLLVQDQSACAVFSPSANEPVTSPTLLSEDPSTWASLKVLDPLTVEDFQWLPLPSTGSLPTPHCNALMAQLHEYLHAAIPPSSTDGGVAVVDLRSYVAKIDREHATQRPVYGFASSSFDWLSRGFAARIRQSISRHDNEEMGICFLHARPPIDQLKTDTSEPRIMELLDNYEDVFQAPAGVVLNRPIRHGITLEDDTVPPRGCIYRMSEEELQVLRAQLDDLLAKGWIRPSRSPYGAPVLFVWKKNKDLRLCIDYRKLNAQTIKKTDPLPRIDDLLERLGGAKYFSKLDLKSGYHQIKIQPRDRYKTTFKMRHGHFEWIVMPFGLTNAPATFRVAMTMEFRDLLDRTVLIYLDDIFIYSRSLDEHLEHLHAVLERLRIAKYKANCDKFEFAQQELEVPRGGPKGPNELHGKRLKEKGRISKTGWRKRWEKIDRSGRGGRSNGGGGILEEQEVEAGSRNRPEANGQAEQMNRVVQHLLRHYIKPTQDDWDEQLPLIASLYNYAIHSSTGVIPNQLHLGWKPRSALDFLLPENRPAATPGTLEYGVQYEKLLQEAVEHMKKAQQAMIAYENQHRRQSTFQVGERVWVKASELGQEFGISRKLMPQYFGPWEVLDVVGDEMDGPTYVIRVPGHLRTHPVFHASKLAPFAETDQFPSRRSMLPPTMDGQVDIDDIVDHRDMPVPKPLGRGRPPKPKREYCVRFRHHTDPKEDRWFTREELIETAPVAYCVATRALQGPSRTFSLKA